MHLQAVSGFAQSKVATVSYLYKKITRYKVPLDIQKKIQGLLLHQQGERKAGYFKQTKRKEYFFFIYIMKYLGCMLKNTFRDGEDKSNPECWKYTNVSGCLFLYTDSIMNL